MKNTAFIPMYVCLCNSKNSHVISGSIEKTNKKNKYITPGEVLTDSNVSNMYRVKSTRYLNADTIGGHWPY